MSVAEVEAPAGRFGPFRRVLARPLLRRVLGGVMVSALGDGMSAVAVAWLALLIAPEGQAGLWTGLSIAAYSLPATVGMAVLGPLVRRFNGAGLVAVDASLRCVILGVIATLAIVGVLTPPFYVALLAVSSLLHAWGNAGAYTLVADELPEEDQVAGNALIGTFMQASLIAGPALAGVLTAVVGPGWVIAGDALSFAVLAALCRPAARRTPAPKSAAEPDASGAWSVLRGNRQLLGLLIVTCVFFFLYGPVEVAMPIHIAKEMGANASLLGAYWAVFSVGAVIGGLGVGLLRKTSLWAIVVVIIIGWGAALLPAALTNEVWPGLVGFAVGGVIYGPYIAVSTGLFQRAAPPETLSRVLAFRTALTTPSVGVGMMLGGPIVNVLGGRGTMLASGLLTIALGIAVLLALAVRRAGPRLGNQAITD
jgi:MFS family permease